MTPGRPTEYAGTLFRSRNEARWAAFFDHIGWDWAYEVIEGDSYIADFVILGPHPLLIEVKPNVVISELQDVARSVVRRLGDAWTKDILVVGSVPCPCDDTGEMAHAGVPPAGVLVDREWDFGLNIGAWTVCDFCGEVAVFSDMHSYRCRPCGHHDGDHYLTPLNHCPVHQACEIETPWAKATNDLQWQPGQPPMDLGCECLKGTS